MTKHVKGVLRRLRAESNAASAENARHDGAAQAGHLKLLVDFRAEVAKTNGGVRQNKEKRHSECEHQRDDRRKHGDEVVGTDYDCYEHDVRMLSAELNAS